MSLNVGDIPQTDIHTDIVDTRLKILVYRPTVQISKEMDNEKEKNIMKN